MQGITFTKEVDARGTFCPGPLMEMIRAVKSCSLGDVVAVISSDEGSRKDIPAWIEKAKQEFLGEEAVTGGYRLYCRKIK
ncbi:MAG: sulfurtransferase TusA family protein [Chloroflexi bacterium]|uniref:Sulfurtransferase TusA family protein n=1 Tax=Candidatus Chlorohelix allophototropha TaxID=3003348 RepID=A0A8T7M4I9_9CHLR|nr:sulfurtransferase TusA family protein [Chloroflexota bacterium]WJW70017.1 sulfurtransferase TusA family protein [Chloroflexota bacterium L227-S17]